MEGVFTSQGRQSEAHTEKIEGELLYHCNCWFLKWKDTLKYYNFVINFEIKQRVLFFDLLKNNILKKGIYI